MTAALQPQERPRERNPIQSDKRCDCCGQPCATGVSDAGLHGVRRLREVARRACAACNGSGKSPGGLARPATAPGSRPAGLHGAERVREAWRQGPQQAGEQLSIAVSRLCLLAASFPQQAREHAGDFIAGLVVRAVIGVRQASPAPRGLQQADPLVHRPLRDIEEVLRLPSRNDAQPYSICSAQCKKNLAPQRRVGAHQARRRSCPPRSGCGAACIRIAPPHRASPRCARSAPPACPWLG